MLTECFDECEILLPFLTPSRYPQDVQANAHFILDNILWYGIVMRGILGIFFGNFAFFEGVLPALRRRGEGSPLDIFLVAFLVVGTFILTKKEVTLLANVRDSERL